MKFFQRTASFSKSKGTFLLNPNLFLEERSFLLNFKGDRFLTRSLIFNQQCSFQKSAFFLKTIFLLLRTFFSENYDVLSNNSILLKLKGIFFFNNNLVFKEATLEIRSFLFNFMEGTFKRKIYFYFELGYSVLKFAKGSSY